MKSLELGFLSTSAQQKIEVRHPDDEMSADVIHQITGSFEEAFSALGLLQHFELQKDPIAILDGASEPIDIVFRNRFLKTSEISFDHLAEESPDSADAFKTWAVSTLTSRTKVCHSYDGFLWSSTILDGRWIILKGLPPQPGLAQHASSVQTVYSDSGVQAGLAADRMPVCRLPEPLSDHQRFVREFDWSSTPLGPMDGWPSQLQQTCDMVLTNPNPAAVLWGEGLTMIYNEGYLDIAGVKHPHLMGKSPAGPFVEVWDQLFAERISESFETKQAFKEERLCLLLERLGYSEETYMSFGFLPLLDAEGEVAGFYHPVFEVTQQVLNERRMSMLLGVGETTAGAANLKSFWKLVLQSLDHNEHDVPFAILYSVNEEVEEANEDEQSSSRSSMSSLTSLMAKQCVLEGSLGFPQSHVSISDRLILEDSAIGFAPAFRSVIRSGQPKLLQISDGTLSEALLQGLQTRGYSNKCNAVVVCPLQPTTHDTILGFLVLGLASSRPYDDDYRVFIDLLTRQLRSSLASVVLFEEEQRRGRTAAEEALYQQTQLLMKLQERSQEKERIETRYRLLAERAPVGIFDLNITGGIRFANDAWHEITGHRREDKSDMSWMGCVYEEDMETVQGVWTSLLEVQQSIKFEFRVKNPWRKPTSTDGHSWEKPESSLSPKEPIRRVLSNSSPGPDLFLEHTWVLCNAYPILAEDGTILGVTGTLTDITQQKWSMELQAQRIVDMIEQKRQQENFVDMTSHEMRNPLNAMLQCAENLDETLELLRQRHQDPSDISLLDDCIDSAKTILYCGRHQQNIINDCLTLSKLDAKLLRISPIEVRPVDLVRDALKLFESDARAADVQLELCIHPSYQDLNIQEVLMDPSRVLQILVNFIANGIKFTKGRAVRQMQVTISATSTRPNSDSKTKDAFKIGLFARSGSNFSPPIAPLTTGERPILSGRAVQDPTTRKEWGEGETVYLRFSVRDTGPGLTEEEIGILFERFSQNSPKTHAHYGGSGLGLFISQQLAELQGGEVAIASEVAVGSDFIFYVKVRRAPNGPLPRNIELLSKGIDPPNSKRFRIEPAKDSAAGLSVLIVEDNLVNQRVLTKSLQKLGHRISIANHGEEALSIIERTKIWQSNENTGEDLDIILLDVEMPVMDGRTCVQRIRELQNLGSITVHIPVIAVTANARAEQISGAKGLGFDEVVSKPYRIPELVVQMHKFTRKNRKDSDEIMYG